MLEQTSKCYDAKLTYTSHIARIVKAVVERTGPDARLPLDRIPLRITDGSVQ